MTDLDRQTYREQIRLIYNQGPVLVLGATLCAVLLTVFLWRHVPQATLLFWLGAVSVTAFLRILVIRAYLHADEAARGRPHWGYFFWLGTLSAGCIWGAWPLMFYQLYSTEYLLLISTVFAGMVAVSAAAGSIYLPSFLSFSMPLVIPLSLTHLFSGSDSLALTGLLLIVFLIVNFVLATRGNRQYKELIRARFENQALMDRLEAEKTIAQQAVIAKSRFLAAASHDLRQPLHALGLFLGALRSREGDARQKVIIDDMGKSAEALNSLFNSLLDVSRLDAEIIEFNPRHVPARELFDGLRAQFTRQAGEKDIDLIVRESEHVLYSDVILLERVLRNLLANAIQYTHAGSVTLGCHTGDDGACVVTLEDTGVGIPGDEQGDVFSEYYQLGNPERDRSKGLGLGLAIVRRLCELMDLPLGMESIEGHGTTFRIEVPGGDPAQVAPRRVEPPTLGASGGCVLVIDDEPQVLQGMRHMLEGQGCEVLLAESARDALRVVALAERVPDVILSDYRLRDDTNGVDAIATVREAIERDVPAIVVTGDTSPERLKEVKRTGLELLHKPVAIEELCRVLERLLPDKEVALVGAVTAAGASVPARPGRRGGRAAGGVDRPSAGMAVPSADSSSARARDAAGDTIGRAPSSGSSSTAPDDSSSDSTLDLATDSATDSATDPETDPETGSGAGPDDGFPPGDGDDPTLDLSTEPPADPLAATGSPPRVRASR